MHDFGHELIRHLNVAEGYRFQGVRRPAIERLDPPLPTGRIEELEIIWRMTLPKPVRSLYAVCNGGRFWGCDICDLEEGLSTYAFSDYLCFHNWGTGDFDAVYTGTALHRQGAVVFLRHSVANAYLIAETFEDWWTRAESEVAQFGEVRHPEDLRTDTPAAMYNAIARRLRP